MAKILDKLGNAIAGLKKQTPAVGTALQGITTSMDTLETQLQQMQAQRPANQAQLHDAANTLMELKIQVQALVSSLQPGSSKPVAAGAPPTASGGGS